MSGPIPIRYANASELRLSAKGDDPMVGQTFVLKTTPPRTHRLALARPRLERLWRATGDAAAIVIEAPRGFGKTTLLTQWRRLWLEQGALVAWASLDAQDDPLRFGQALLSAMRTASGRTVFDTLLVQFGARIDPEFDVLTGLLSEIANLATPTVLILDETERLPQETVTQSLAYLLLNAPSNLHVVIGTRSSLALPTAELLARGAMRRLTVSDLRFELDESVAILQARFGSRLGLDDCARLHEITEGWPIGLQLAAATVEREANMTRAVESLSGRHGDIERYFVESLFERLPLAQREFLTRIAILDDLTPELCEYLTQESSAAVFIDQLMADTPILAVAELRDWIRIHPLARDFLLARFERLPSNEQQALHRRAADWYEQRGLFHQAGRHALAAGDTARAQEFAEESLLDLMRNGRIGEARQWMRMIPKSQIEADPALQLAATWVMALGDRPAEALHISHRISDAAQGDDETRFVAALIYTCAAAFCDRAGLIEEGIAPWPVAPAGVSDPAYLLAHANTLATVALFRGDTDAVRRITAAAPSTSESSLTVFPRAIGHMLAGLSHLRDGNAYRAAATLQLTLLQAERDTGRRSAPSSMLAGALAATLLERGDDAAVQSLLANRLDTIERTGLPDSQLAAYRALAVIAWRKGDDRRALDVLDQLRTLGTERGIPRMVMVSLAEQVRIHALAAHPETAHARFVSLEAMRPAFRRAEFAPFLPLYDLTTAIARAYVAFASRDIGGAQDALKRADVLSAKLGRGREAIVIKALRAVAADEHGHADVAAALIREADGLAAIGGLARVIADTHPRAAALVGNIVDTASVRAAPIEAPRAATARAGIVQGGLLTPKEAQILRLLDANMSNKTIARSMDISDETVKWHLKNLFSKLSAGTRKHAVDRARLLGLISA